MAKFIQLSADEVSERDFPVEYKGYKVEEVDRFLDTIVADYELFAKTNKENEDKIQQLLSKINALENELATTIANLKLTKQQQEELARQGVNSSDFIKRLSALEKNNYSKD
ncbi:DivIVA domain-containing protein [Spiroplasma culicicola]|uniref:DivIVA domain-containing protein n=1 Tax=Spiroplasma culicicola AES-1 TaxID=1276246 RepID=W6A6R8_9MOLU|nr:DivIVA domain-containing protein [Spiroplasma culicicola]AHI52666.1 DivIVA domain-containing protein [Spiroplasma culicicola AES-1]